MREQIPSRALRNIASNKHWDVTAVWVSLTRRWQMLLRNPVEVEGQPGGKIKYVGTNATVVLNSDGEVVTTWSRQQCWVEEHAMSQGHRGTPP